MKHLLCNPFRLRREGVIGINARNLRYVKILNSRSVFPLVDNKLTCKRLLEKNNIATPTLYRSCKSVRNVLETEQSLRQYTDGFVIKPAKGSGGKGVLIITEVISDKNNNAMYRKSSGALINSDDLVHFIKNIINGVHSNGDNQDTALIEEIIEPGSPLNELVWQGIPDVRLIVYRGFPLMAMARLPTLKSDGCANLHKDAVGAGIRIKDGTLNKATMDGKEIEQHPDTLSTISGKKIPSWQSILTTSSKLYELTCLGFYGVDLVINKSKSAKVLEINARPGISIQLANKTGLSKALKLIDNIENIESYKNKPEKRCEYVIDEL